MTTSVFQSRVGESGGGMGWFNPLKPYYTSSLILCWEMILDWSKTGWRPHHSFTLCSCLSLQKRNAVQDETMQAAMKFITVLQFQHPIQRRGQALPKYLPVISELTETVDKQSKISGLACLSHTSFWPPSPL